MHREAARQFLFGLIALRNGLIDTSALADATRAWKRDPSRSLADLLIDARHIDETRQGLVESLAKLHLQAHADDPEQSLASITADLSTREHLQSLGDPELEATLSQALGTSMGPDRNGPERAPSSPSPSDGGRFRVLRPHARGGLGAVFVALDSELNREVALKQILENRADDPRSRGRFLIEAEITGGLEHPGIVPVYGLGTNHDGRPYYAMRFIRGESLKEAIDAFHRGPRSGPERSLGFRQLLKRFTDACNAIEYAHSRGVLHRDIKPANMIVGKHGETLVVDWGLAKALGESSSDGVEGALVPSSSDGSSETLPGQAMGTPAYMSPEQARGDLDSLGPRSDVYSLGATLHCLITGRAPFEGPPAAILKAVERGEFRRPRELDASIDPALEAIALKAMAREPADRYSSARELATEVDRWLADEKVGAYPEPWTRSLNRWLTRHRTAVTGLAAAGLVALVGLGIVSAVQTRAKLDLDAKNGELERANRELADSNRALDIQRGRAEERETQAIEAVRRFKDVVMENDELRKNPALEPLRKALLQEPLNFFGKLRDRLEADDDTRPASLAELARVAFDHAFLVNVVGGKQDAIEAYEHSRDILERLSRDHPGVALYRSRLADSHHNLGLLLRDTGRTDGALMAFEKGREIRQRLVEENPGAADYQADLSDSNNDLGNLLSLRGRNDEALSAYGRARDLRQHLSLLDPKFDEHRARLATIRNNLGNLLRDQGRNDEALKEYQMARAARETLAAARPEVHAYRADLAASHNNIGNLLQDRGLADEARVAYEKARDILDGLVHDHPEVTLYRAQLAASENNLGVILGATGRHDESLVAYERGRDTLQQLANDHPDVNLYRFQLGGCHYNLGTQLAEKGRFEDARASYTRATRIFERLATDQPDVAQYQSNWAACHNILGVLLQDTKHPEEALVEYERAREIRERLAKAHPDLAGYQADLAASLVNLGMVLREIGRTEDASRVYEQSRDIHRRLAEAHPDVPDYANTLGFSWDNMAAIDLTAARYAEALEKFRQADPWHKKALAANPRHARYRRFYESHQAGLIRALRGLNLGDEADLAEGELAEFRLNDPRFEALDRRLQAVEQGGEPADNAERLAMAQRAYDKGHYASAARLWSEAFEADQGLADRRSPQHRYNAACAAALAADGRGIDPPARDERARLRSRALDWLKSERAAWTKALEAGAAQARVEVAKTLRYWGMDSDLMSVRDQEPLARLAEPEQVEWRAFWESVAALLARAE
ncbi:MAG: serine/threonine-protein kinase [Isosphaeraceae bacterium]